MNYSENSSEILTLSTSSSSRLNPKLTRRSKIISIDNEAKNESETQAQEAVQVVQPNVISSNAVNVNGKRKLLHNGKWINKEVLRCFVCY
jgi:hypothetical protein